MLKSKRGDFFLTLKKTFFLQRTWTVALCAIVFGGTACKKKSYVATEFEREEKVDGKYSPSSDSPGRIAAPVESQAHSGRKEEGEHAAVVAVKSRPSSPTLYVVEPNLSNNIEQSLKNRVPKGPDCERLDGKAASCAAPLEFKSAFLNYLFRSLYASTTTLENSLRLLPDRTFPQSQLMALVKNDSEATADFSKIANLHLYSDADGSIYNSFQLALTFTNGQEIWAEGNSDTLESCQLLEMAFPLNSGKEYFEAREISSSEKVRLQHPYHGRSCQTAILESYRILNFYSKETDAVESQTKNTPSLVFLIAKNSQKKSSYIVSRRSRGDAEVLGRIEAAMNSNVSGRGK